MCCSHKLGSLLASAGSLLSCCDGSFRKHDTVNCACGSRLLFWLQPCRIDQARYHLAHPGVHVRVLCSLASCAGGCVSVSECVHLPPAPTTLHHTPASVSLLCTNGLLCLSTQISRVHAAFFLNGTNTNFNVRTPQLTSPVVVFVIFCRTSLKTCRGGHVSSHINPDFVWIHGWS